MVANTVDEVVASDEDVLVATPLVAVLVEVAVDGWVVVRLDVVLVDAIAVVVVGAIVDVVEAIVDVVDVVGGTFSV